MFLFSILTVCSTTDAGFQCQCEEQFAWPYSVCVAYGACDDISNGVCTCINRIPADDQSCQPISGNRLPKSTQNGFRRIYYLSVLITRFHHAEADLQAAVG